MFIPTWIFVTFFVLYFIRIVIACIFRQKALKSISKLKFPNIVKAFDATFEIGNKTVHAFIDKEGKFTIDTPNPLKNE